MADPKKRSAWKFRLAIHRFPYPRAFYDCDGDGQIDLIRVGKLGSEQATHEYVRTKGKWEYRVCESPVIELAKLKLSDNAEKRMKTILSE